MSTTKWLDQHVHLSLRYSYTYITSHPDYKEEYQKITNELSMADALNKITTYVKELSTFSSEFKTLTIEELGRPFDSMELEHSIKETRNQIIDSLFNKFIIEKFLIKK